MDTNPNPRKAASSAPPARRARVLAEHSIEGVDGVSGVTFDGERLWFVDRYRGTLRAVDPETGRVERELRDLGLTGGLTFDGRNLRGISHDTIVEIDRDSGKILKSIPVPAGASGLAFADGAFWMGRYSAKEIVKIDPKSGKVLKTLPSDRFVTGVSWIDGELWHGAWEFEESKAKNSELRRVDPESGAVVETAAMDGFVVSGIEGDRSGRVWCGASKAGRLRAVARR